MKRIIQIIRIARFALLPFLGLANGLTGMEISNQILGLQTQGNHRIVEAPTQFGVSGGGVYTVSGTMQAWHAGPGLFFDYRLNSQVTVSAETFLLMYATGDNFIDRVIKPGIYIKHWLNESWGYTGIGVDAAMVREETGDSHLELMLSLLLTGENLSLASRVNSTGDLKLSVTVLDRSNSPETRFSVMYNLGIGFDLSASP